MQGDGTIAFMSKEELEYRDSQGQIQWVGEKPYWYGSEVFDISKCNLPDNFKRY